MSESVPACDRCGVCHPLVHLIGWTVGEDARWLCQACINTIVLAWLVEHQQLIDRTRQDRATRQARPC